MTGRYPTAASSYAGDIDGLILFIAALVFFWGILVEVVFFGFIFKFREKKGRKAEYVTGEEKRQKRWITIPHALVFVCDILIIVAAVRVWVDVKQTLPTPDATVRVISQQWAWTFVHPGPDGALDTADDITTVDELHLEVGKTYHYELESKDVVHSLSIPAFRLKQDAVPGRTIRGWFRPIREGTYDLQCAEICGIGHGLMPAIVKVESAAQHARWMDEAGRSALAAAPRPRAR
ncbi:MAG: cytochrome c oxidase subunit II [Pseudomonadota bacterium]